MCFGVNTPSSGSLQVMLAEVMNHQMTKYNVVICCYDKILVNMATYVIYSSFTN